MIGGIALETIYWCTLLICAGLTVPLIIFGGVFDFDGPLDPMFIVPWSAFTGLLSFLGERLTSRSSLFLFIASGGVSIVLIFLLNFYILMPMKHAESMISSSEKTLEGQVTAVIIPIPVRGMGEIQLKSVTGSISRPTCFYNPQEQTAERGTKVLIIKIEERICYIMPYESMIKT